MVDLVDLYPGFRTHWIETDEGRIFARSGGDGPPLLLLHGYPQTHVEWHKIAPALAAHYTVVLMDLRGYGASFFPAGTNGAGMSKRAMGSDAIAVMEALGFSRFRIVGHDRGGRVAYRLGFDRPERIEKIVVIDIIPTASMFRGLGAITSALKKYHWLFLAQPAPFPETLIGASAGYFLEHTLASWTKAKDLSAFDPRALAHYHASFDPRHIHSTCECYRAGALIDRLQDEEDLDAGRKIPVPILAVWGEAGIPAAGISPVKIWQDYALNVEGLAIPSGHFVPEENPTPFVEAVLAFLKGR